MYLASRLQRYPPMGRLVSVVSSRAALNGSSAFLTQTLRVSFQGLRNAMYLPSGEIWAPAISGFPNRSSRSIRGGRLWAPAEDTSRVDASTSFLILNCAEWGLQLSIDVAATA